MIQGFRMIKKTETTLFTIKTHGIAANINDLCENAVAIPCNKRYCER